MTVFKIETDIITSITASLMERAVILFIMYVKTFITDVTVFVGNILINLNIFSMKVRVRVMVFNPT
jgi:hypothetical protein